MMIRDSFVFYKSYFDAIEQLKEKEQLMTYRAICDYALNGVETTELDGISGIIYTMAKPIIDSNNKKYKNGVKGGRPNDNDAPRIDIKDVEYVNLTEPQYKRACEKFGENIVNKAISCLESWLALKGRTQEQYLGKNHYGFFKSDNWVIKKAQAAIKEEEVNGKNNVSKEYGKY
jgi:hypothetical protein